MNIFFLSTALASLVGFFTVVNSTGLVPTVCHTSACLSAASNLMASINFSVNPCDNFYEYACGKWRITHNKRVNDYQNYDTIQMRKLANSAENIEFLKQPNDASEPRCVHTARKLFNSCMDTDVIFDVSDKIDSEGIRPLKKILNLVNLTSTPPVLSGDADFDLLLTTVKMHRWLGIEMFYSLQVQPDPFNETRHLVSVQRPDLSDSNSPLRTVSALFVNELKNVVQLEAHYDAYISTAFAVLCENSSSELCGKPLTLDNALMTAFALNKLEKYRQNLQKIKWKPPTDAETFREIITLEKLQNLTDNLALESQTSSINWTRNIELMFEGVKSANLSLQNDMEILIHKSYVENVMRFIYSYSLADHELGTWWEVVDSFAEYSVSRLRNAKMNLWKTLFGIGTRETWCEKAVGRLYGPVIGYRYSVDPLYNETKFKAIEMAENIRTVFANFMNATLWMDSKTKKRAIQKLKSMKAFIAFPDPVYNKTISYKNLLDRWFPKSDHDLAHDFLNFTLSKISKSMLGGLNMLNRVNDLLWDEKAFFFILPPILVNAYYYLEKNSLIIPAGILGVPLCGNGLEALNYGSIGTIIGHEMTHGFDTLGRFYNNFGQQENWWEPETMKMYNERSKCLVDTYDKMTTNGLRTLSENIADTGGFREALSAYRLYVSKNGPEPHLPDFKNYTHEQLFTLAYAHTYCTDSGILSAQMEQYDVHSRNEARINGVVANSDEFSRIWNCAADSPMHKKNDDECYVW